MGMKMASTYVTLTLAFWEKNLYEIIGEKVQWKYKKLIY